MKQKQPDGSVAIIYSNRLTHTNSQRDSFRSFAGHYAQFGWLEDPDLGFVIKFFAYLNDGKHYEYTYEGGGDAEGSEFLVNQIRQDLGGPLGATLGGRFYNPSVRPNLLRKQEIP